MALLGIDTSNWERNLRHFKEFADNTELSDNARIQLTKIAPEEPGEMGKLRRITVNPNQDTAVLGWFSRGKEESVSNEAIRRIFLKTIAAYYGGNMKAIPDSVRSAMNLDKFDGLGRPLTAHRVRLVMSAMEAHEEELKQLAWQIANDNPGSAVKPAKDIKYNNICAWLTLSMTSAQNKAINSFISKPNAKNFKELVSKLGNDFYQRVEKANYATEYKIADGAEPVDLDKVQGMDAEDLTVIRERFIDQLMTVHPGLRKAIAELPQQQFDAANELLERECPSDFNEQAKWAEKSTLLSTLKINTLSNVSEVKTSFLNDTKQKENLTDIVGLAIMRLKPSIENLKAVLPREEENAKQLLDEIRDGLLNIKERISNDTLNGFDAMQELKTLADRLNNIHVVNRTPAQRWHGVIKTLIHDGIPKAIVNFQTKMMFDAHNDKWNALGMNDAPFRAKAMEKFQEGFNHLGNQFITRLDEFMNMLAENPQKLSVKADTRKKHLELLQSYGNYPDDAYAEKLLDKIYLSMKQTALLKSLENLGDQNSSTNTAFNFALENSFNRFINSLMKERIPANGLVTQMNLDKMNEIKDFFTNRLTESFKKSMDVNYTGNSANSCVDSPFLPLTIREYNHKDVKFNGKYIPSRPQDPDKYKDVTCFKGQSLYTTGNFGHNGSKTAFGEFLEREFSPGETIRRFVSVALSMSCGLPNLGFSLLAGGDDDIQDDREKLTLGYKNPTEEADRKKYIDSIPVKNHSFEITRDDDGNTTIKCKAQFKTVLNKINSMMLELPPVTSDISFGVELYIPSEQADPENPTFEIRNITQTLNPLE